MKVKINVLLASLPPVLVLPVPIALRRILVEVLILLGVTAGYLTGMDLGRTSVDGSRLFRLCT